MFDTIRDVTEYIERNEPIPNDVATQAKVLTTCGFCAERMDVYRNNNQIYIRFGSCGHLFHAEPNDLRQQRACYSHYIDAKKRDPHVCIHCRRQAVGVQNAPKRRKIDERIEPPASPTQSQSLSHISDSDEGQL